MCPECKNWLTGLCRVDDLLEGRGQTDDLILTKRAGKGKEIREDVEDVERIGSHMGFGDCCSLC